MPIRRRSLPILAFCAFLQAIVFATLCLGQVRPTGPVLPKSTTVAADDTVTFRFLGPNAKAVGLVLEGLAKPVPMEKGADGVWSYSTKLAPEIYGYEFIVDGAPVLDATQSYIKTNLVNTQAMVLVPGSTPEPWEQSDIPHGEVHHHFYTSKTVANLPGGNSDYYVYTPPGYDPNAKQPYPVLYLLHGYTDNASAWTAVGQANYILDSLLAAGKIKPMVVVMPFDYGDMEMVSRGWSAWQDKTLVKHNFDLYRKTLLTEVMPRAEAGYRIATDRDHRAIAGLSMGGAESLLTGLNNVDSFAWIGSFSSGGESKDFDEEFAGLKPADAARLKLLWVACGTEDPLLTINQGVVAWLRAKQMPVTAIETPGMHTWMVWRDNLVHFAPLLFQK